jgi:HPt (histidine-containing phosphotransfer) domain-containing protein
MEAQFNLDEPIDLITGSTNVGGEDLFYLIMDEFEDMTLMKNLTNMKEDVENKDYKKLREEAHSLKGASGYLAAGRVHKLSEQIQKAIDTNDIAKAISLYPRLIEESIMLRIHIKKLLSKRKSN